MSSVHLADSKPNWFCHFYDPEGFRRKRSTGTTKRAIASTICTAMQRAARLAGDGKLSNERALKLIREVSPLVPLTLMSQYTPIPAVAGHPLLGRRVTREEYERVVNAALDLGFEELYTQEVDDWALNPDFAREKPFDWESTGGRDNV